MDHRTAAHVELPRKTSVKKETGARRLRASSPPVQPKNTEGLKGRSVCDVAGNQGGGEGKAAKGRRGMGEKWGATCPLEPIGSQQTRLSPVDHFSANSKTGRKCS